MFKTLLAALVGRFKPVAITPAPTVLVPIPIEAPVTAPLATAPKGPPLSPRLQGYLRAAFEFRLKHGRYPRQGQNSYWAAADRAEAKALGMASPSTYFAHWGPSSVAWDAADAWGRAEHPLGATVPPRIEESPEERLVRMRAIMLARVPARLPEYLRVAYQFRLQTGRFPRRAHGNTGTWHPEDRELARSIGVASPNTYCKHWGSLQKAWVAAEAQAAEESECLA